MKKHLRILAVIIVFVVCVTTGANANTEPFTVEELQRQLEGGFEDLAISMKTDGTPFYFDVHYNKSKEALFIEVAIDSVADKVYTAISEGYGATWEEWARIKTAMLMLYGYIMSVVDMCENKNIELCLRLVDDNVYIDDEWTPGYTTLYEIGFRCTVMFDIMDK